MTREEYLALPALTSVWILDTRKHFAPLEVWTVPIETKDNCEICAGGVQLPFRFREADIEPVYRPRFGHALPEDLYRTYGEALSAAVVKVLAQ